MLARGRASWQGALFRYLDRHVRIIPDGGVLLKRPRRTGGPQTCSPSVAPTMARPDALACECGTAFVVPIEGRQWLFAAPFRVCMYMYCCGILYNFVRACARGTSMDSIVAQSACMRPNLTARYANLSVVLVAI